MVMPSQYRAIWTVPGGGTGYSVLHFANVVTQAAAQAAAARIRSFFLAMAPNLPDDVQINFDSEVLILDVAGALTGVFAVTPPPVVNGSSSGAYSRATGARVDWSTGSIIAGRRLTGRTYIVPVVGASFDTEGVLNTTAKASIQAGADALLANLLTDGNQLLVWSRVHAVTQVVQSASVPPAGAILRGRRD